MDNVLVAAAMLLGFFTTGAKLFTAPQGIGALHHFLFFMPGSAIPVPPPDLPASPAPVCGEVLVVLVGYLASISLWTVLSVLVVTMFFLAFAALNETAYILHRKHRLVSTLAVIGFSTFMLLYPYLIDPMCR